MNQNMRPGLGSAECRGATNSHDAPVISAVLLLEAQP